MNNVIPLSILIPSKNEERNLENCLKPLVGWANEIVLVDSQSTDKTLEIASKFNEVKVLQFFYAGGYPKKRQWALDTYNFKNEWILLLDSDEILLPETKIEIEKAIQSKDFDGYWLKFNSFFLGRILKYGATVLLKLSLFKIGKGKYEVRIADQDITMGDMEVHEHVVVDGKVGKIKSPVRHENYNSLFRYIQKHNEYSNWDAAVYVNEDTNGEIKPSLWGSLPQRRRWLKVNLISMPGLPAFMFFYCYFFKLGFLDGRPGFYYSYFRGIQILQIKAKMYELKLKSKTIN